MRGPSGTGDRGTIEAFIDLRSPYSYLAKDPARALAEACGAELVWRPYAIDIEAAYGAPDTRDARALRKVKYLYMDVRRLAEPQGLTILGPKQIYDPSLAHKGMLFAVRAGIVEAYIDTIYERFFLRDIEIEDLDAVSGVIGALGGSEETFAAYLNAEATQDLAAATERAESFGVFGVPAFVYQNELYWGPDRLPLLRAAMTSA